MNTNMNTNMNNKFIKLNNDKIKYVINLTQEYNLDKETDKKTLNKLLLHVKNYENIRNKFKKNMSEIKKDDNKNMKELIKNIMVEFNNINDTFKFDKNERDKYIFNIINDLHSNKQFYNNLENLFANNNI